MIPVQISDAVTLDHNGHAKPLHISTSQVDRMCKEAAGLHKPKPANANFEG
jgi:hypothetical protein